MGIEKNINKEITTKTADELILVVKRKKLINEPWHGLKEFNFEDFANLIEKESEFLPRSLMENDPEYKQIIPYLIFCNEKKLFLMQRQAKATEQRLKNKYTLGIGGHIRQEDMNTKNIIDWAKREFEEEVNYAGTYEVKPLGLLNDDTNLVGQVHLGIVFMLFADTNQISIKSELKGGELLDKNECDLYYDLMESWSKICYDFIKTNSII